MNNFVMCKKLLASTVLAVCISTPAFADDRFFIEGSVGAGFGIFDELEFVNPAGVPFTTNNTSGNQILLTQIDDVDVSFNGKVGIGYFVHEKVFMRASYTHLGRYETSGYADFGVGGNFRQDLEVSAHSFMAEAGYHQPVTDSLFLEVNGGAGLALVDIEGKQGRNLGEDNYFPDNDDVTWAVNVGGAVGHRISEQGSIVVSGGYTFVGDVETGVTTGGESQRGAGINAGEQLKSHLDTAHVMIGFRYQF